ncbi:MAG: inositol phosphatase [Deltaproteobacteria bacterium]|nr:inositol phosphatase [Deltaproteobacteria bacterium]
MPLDLPLAMATARRAAEAAAAAALPHFRQGVRVEVKPDRSPVTVADREAEAAAVTAIRAAFPGHAILGEESGAHAGSEARWVIDPIDGTRGFTRGGSFWGPLIALEAGGTVVAGAMALPALDETYWAAKGLGCWQAVGGGEPRRLQVSGISDWAESTLSLGEMRFLLAPPLDLHIGALVRSAASTRCYGDLAGAAMLLTGRCEAWLEAGVQLWDIAALQVLVEEAGGRFTDFEGRPSAAGGRCVASNGRVHERVLSALLG